MLAVALLALLALTAVAAVVVVVRYLPMLDTVRDARDSARRLESSVSSLADIDAGRLQSVRGDLEALDTHLAPIRDALASDPLIGVARHLPFLDRQLAGADDVTAAADELLAVGRTAVGIGDRFLAIRQSADTAPLEGLVELMATSGAEVDDMVARLATARQRLAAVPDGVVDQIGEVRDLMAGPIDRYAESLATYAAYDEVIPRMLGWQGRKRYLVLAQDPAELRPTGGFTGTYGLVTFEDGRLTERRFHDVYTLDAQPGLPYVQPPDALRDHLLGDFPWQLADANWSPDFPTSAQNAVRMYELESGDNDIDGVIGITTFAIDRILGVTGPIHVPDYDTTVAAGETTLKSLALTRAATDPDVNRKQFLDDFGAAVLDALFDVPTSGWQGLLSTLGGVGDERLASVWFEDPVLQAAVEGTPWAGEVRQDPGDFVFVVDANQAPASKYNLVVTRSTDLDIRLDTDGNARTALTLTYHNDAGREGEPYASLRAWSTNPDGVLATYVRVLTPRATEIDAVAGGGLAPVSAPESIDTEAGRNVFANYLLAPPGDTVIRYRWSSPGVVARTALGAYEYRLTIQKQPGMGSEPTVVRVRLPEGAQVTSLPAGASFELGIVSLETVLEHDLELVIGFEH